MSTNIYSKMVFYQLFLVIVVLCITPVSATDYYVSTDGSNTNDGLSIENAWNAPSYAATQVNAGDTIYLVNGTWYKESVDFTNNGTFGKPIILTSYNGTPTFDGMNPNLSPITFGFDLQNTEFIIISNVKVFNYTHLVYAKYANNISILNSEFSHSGGFAVGISNVDSHNMLIDNCSIHDSGWNGIQLQGNREVPAGSGIPSTYITVTNNIIYENWEHNSIDLYGNLQHIIISNNTIYNGTDSGIYSHSILDNQWDVTIENNIIYNVPNGIKLENVHNSNIMNNWIYNIPSYGIYTGIGSDNVTFVSNNISSIGDPFSVGDSNMTMIGNKFGSRSHYRIGKNSMHTVADSANIEYSIRSDYGANITVKHTDNKVMETTWVSSSLPYEMSDILYTPDMSYMTMRGDSGYSGLKVGFISYPFYLRPTQQYLKVISVDNTSLQVHSDFVTNPTWVSTSLPEYSNTQVVMSVDGVSYKTESANSSGFVSFYYDGTWDADHTFTFEVSNESVSSSVAIIPSTTQTTPNTQFTLAIPITPETPIAGAQFDLNFDNSLATVTSVTEGNLLDQDGATTLFNSGTINNAAGSVTNIYGSILGETSVSSQGSLATISMTAGSTTGYLNLNLANIIISDADSNAAPYTLTNATILIDTAPVLSSIGAKSVDEGSVLAFTLDASDADGDSLTYTTTNLPTGASFNTATGAFSWTPVDGEAGTYVVTFEVTDGYISDSETVTITVNVGNNVPVITTFVPANSLTFNEVDVITVGIIATDADGDVLTYDIKINGVTKSTSSNYVWETDYSSAGTYTIDITVSDGTTQVTDSRTVTINDVHPRWDVNEDGTVDVLDISTIGRNYGTSVEAPCPRWDVNQDGVVNVQDMALTGSHFGETVA